MPMKNDRDWYWYVAGDTTRVYSSARNIYVDPATDVAYQNWAQNNSPAPIVSEVELWAYMQNIWPAWLYNGTTFSQPGVDQYTQTQLISYASLVRYNCEQAGTVASGVPVATDERGLMLINGARWACDTNPSWTTIWVGTDGQHYPVNQAQMIDIANIVTNRTEQTYTTFDGVRTDINNTTITTLAQIDAAFSGIV